jgi:hypothetical protein
MFAFFHSKPWKKRNLFMFAPLLALDFNYGIENTNILSYNEATYTLDFNRLRLETTLEHKEYEPLLARLIIDNETRYSSQQKHTTNKIKIYRAYLEFAGEKHFMVLGRQRVPFGVGRIWNPIDVFNPIDSFSIETAERKGTDALRYEYAMSDLSNLDITVSKEKSAVRVKGFLQYADLALVGVVDSKNDRNIIGYEAAGELFETKIELRSEGGSFYDRNTGERYTEFIFGADYGFKNSFTILGEYRYNDKIKTDYFGTSLSYQPTPLIVLTLLNITQLKDQSSFTAPSIEYSLSDDMTLRCGAFFYNGGDTDEFGSVPDSYYLNFYVHF